MLRHPLIIAFLILFSTAGAAHPAEVSPEVQIRLARAGEGESIPVILFFKQGVDLDQFKGGRSSAGELIKALRADAGESQARVLAFLRERGLNAEAQSFWINNTMALKAGRRVIEDLCAFEEVERIVFDAPACLPETAGAPREEAPGGRAYGWNIEMMRADEVWNTLGLTGNGIVIGHMDSGADINHPALQGKWRGGTNSWFDPINGMPGPYDDHGHGTRTMGVLVGGDGPGPFTPDTGIAFGAKFICAKIFNQYGALGSESVLISAAQWMMDPDGNPGTDDFPHVISNSWLLADQADTVFHSAAAAWRAAGIIPVCAIGNYGPDPGTTYPPGNYNNVIGVGATTSADQVWNLSSRGPSPEGGAFPADRRKPDLAAPGDAIYTTTLEGNYGTYSGTSLATPHVTAAVALMMEADPSLNFDRVYAKLAGSAEDLSPAGYDPGCGYGRVDAFGAAERALGIDFIVTGPGPGPANPPLVRTFDPLTSGDMQAEWPAYGPRKYGVNVACGHVANDDPDEVITGPGPGTMLGPHVRVFSGDGTPVYWAGFIAYGIRKYGVNVAAGDIDGDGYDEVITGPGPGAVFGPHVRGWDLDGSPPVEPIAGVNFIAYGTRKYGVKVSCGDIDGDGYDEILTTPGPGQVFGSHVRGWNYDGSGETSAMGKVSFFAYGTGRWGVNAACGDLDADGYDEILTGAGPGPEFPPHVRGWNYDGDNIAAIQGVNFIAYAFYRYGAEVGSANLDADEFDEILTMPGPGPSNPPEAGVWYYNGGSVSAGFVFNAYEGMNLGYGGKITGGTLY